jgi:hypothetical protein
MFRAYPLLLVLPAIAFAEAPVRELVYPAAVVGGQIVPLYDKGYLIYLHRPNRLEVFRPDGSPAFNMDLPCPGTGSCSAGWVAADSHGNIAVTFGYLNANGKRSGIRIVDGQGKELRFIETSPFVPANLAFDRNGDLWSLGWERDTITGSEEKKDYPLVRKFSADGKEIGRYLPRSLWPGKKSHPGGGGRGYWQMYSGKDRIGAVVHRNHADNPAEWIEWDLNGNLMRRSLLPGHMEMGRAYAGDGRLYGRFLVEGRSPELRVFDASAGTWTPVSANLPEREEFDRAMLLGADGEDLVYRLGPGNVRLFWARPSAR